MRPITFPLQRILCLLTFFVCILLSVSSQAQVDLNGDGQPDLLWQDETTGDIVVWYMQGATWTGNWDYIANGVPTEWQIVGNH